MAKAEGDADRVADELFRIAASFEESAELRDALTDPRIPAERKSGVITELLGSRASALTTSLVDFIVASGRARDLSTIATRLVEHASETRGKTTAEVRSAVELDAATVARLEEALSRSTGRPVEVQVVIDSSVLGGLVARIGDTIIDGSLRGRLESLRQTLEAQ
ncbi:MAG: ATP synthase F1 subunit delta [Acidimicrobiia bacterium]|nr:ATP synthase F1 subunit delta [Acidimicrobiia bacterium]